MSIESTIDEQRDSVAVQRLVLPVRLGERPARYYNWKSHFTGWTQREEEIAHAAYIAGWYHRCNQDPDAMGENASLSIPGGEPGYTPSDCSDARCPVCKQRNSRVRYHVNDDGSVTVWHCNIVGCSNHIEYPNAGGHLPVPAKGDRE